MSLMFAARMLSAAAVAAAGVSLAAPAASAASAPGSCYYYDYNYQAGACAYETTNFSESNVSVWDDPYHPAAVLGVRSAGQAWSSLDFVPDGAAVTCHNGAHTTFWYQGKITGGVAWVPDCYLNGEPT
jgi:hypothetical protein